jgi:hypothetical protein
MLAQREFCRRLARLGLGRLDLPLFGPDARVHDAVTQREGAFEETVCGVEHLRGAGFRNVRAHTVWLKQNCALLFEIAELAESITGRPLENVTLAAPASWRLDRYESVGFDFDSALGALAAKRGSFSAGLVRRCVALLVSKAPFCLLRKWFPDLVFSVAGVVGRTLVSGADRADRAGRVDGAGSQAQGGGGQGPKHRRGRRAPHRVDAVDFEKRPERGALLKILRPCPFSHRCAAGRICAGLYPETIRLFGTKSLRPL